MKGFSIFLAVGLAASTEAARLPLCSVSDLVGYLTWTKLTLSNRLSA